MKFIKNLSVDHKYKIFYIVFYKLNCNNLHASIILYANQLLIYLKHILFVKKMYLCIY